MSSSPLSSQNPFKLHAEYAPAGDQPDAIRDLVTGFQTGLHRQTLLGATGTGKTFTMANVIHKIQKPTLVLSHNKTLAAQLATEFKYFFPKNAVHYFISYFDYYQPESYLPTQDLYIEKEATINQEIEMYRLGTLASLLTRPDVIVVASVSALYGLGKKEFFRDLSMTLHVGQSYDFLELKKKLIKMQYHPVASKIEQGLFEFAGERLDIYASTDKILYRLHFDEDKLQLIEKKDALTMRDVGSTDHAVIRPATQFLQDVGVDLESLLVSIEEEKTLRIKEFEQAGNLVAAQRIDKRVSYDVRMIRETGFVNGIENYSPYFDKRLPGEPPNTLFDYFPDDFLLIVDESHMTLPQLAAMPAGDRSRKVNLIDHGFRLPSAIDHRPLRFQELSALVGRPEKLKNESCPQDSGIKKLKVKRGKVESQKSDLLGSSSIDLLDVVVDEIKDSAFVDDTTVDKVALQQEFAYTKSTADRFRGENSEQRTENNLKLKTQNSKLPKVQTLFVSATPAPYELLVAEQKVEQVIRPTGLLDPVTYVYPKSGNYELLMSSLSPLVKKKPQVKEYLGV